MGRRAQVIVARVLTLVLLASLLSPGFAAAALDAHAPVDGDVLHEHARQHDADMGHAAHPDHHPVQPHDHLKEHAKLGHLLDHLVFTPVEFAQPAGSFVPVFPRPASPTTTALNATFPHFRPPRSPART